MNIEGLRNNLKEGDVIEIKGRKYEIVKLIMEALPAPSKNPPSREHLTIELYEKGKKSNLIPTAALMVFKDNGDIVFTDRRKLNKSDVKIS